MKIRLYCTWEGQWNSIIFDLGSNKLRTYLKEGKTSELRNIAQQLIILRKGKLRGHFSGGTATSY